MVKQHTNNDVDLEMRCKRCCKK